MLSKTISAELCRVKTISARSCFREDRLQERIDEQYRIGARAKTLELRMTRVAARFTGEPLSRKQAFTPARGEAAGVKVPRVQTPQAHTSPRTQRLAL